MKLFSFCYLMLFALGVSAQKYEHNETLTYEETIAAYKALDEQHERAQLLTYGTTDIGKPLHLFVIANQAITPEAAKNKRVVLINNAIHPGEPCGVDASVQLAQDLLNPKFKRLQSMNNVVVAIIPMYNIGGALNRGCCSRANQNGPAMYGFRGNAKNLDLNRDFIKCDSENARAFASIYQTWQPDIFIDTHTSNGADYQYVMTLIATQYNKLHPDLGQYSRSTMVPALYRQMKKNGYPMSPYVHAVDGIPDNGIMDYLETPRYSTGYSTLFNSFGFVTETHMLKPYKERVLSTYEFLLAAISYAEEHSEELAQLIAQANVGTTTQQKFPIEWELDTTQFEWFAFDGYAAKYKPSNVSGKDRLYYDRKAPWTKDIKYFSTYKATKHVQKPAMYVIPQAWKAVIERLQMNGIVMQQLVEDTALEVEVYYIENYDTGRQPYEGHYLHHSVTVSKDTQRIQYRAGDYIISTNQPRNRFIVETLEPEATDSYFNWGFFDAILQQKEWFSPYVFEELAEEVLQQQPALKQALEERMKADQEFANNPWGPLYFIYQHSPYYEKTRMRYPVARINRMLDIQLK